MDEDSFYCDDLVTTVEGMKVRDVEFTDGIMDPGYGLEIYFINDR